VGTDAVANAASGAIEWWPLLAGLLGGLGLFLLGVQRLTSALKAITGDRLRRILARLTTNRFTAAATGVGMTAIVQSSTITTVLTVGFVSAGLLATAPALGVVLGANVGTTITAQIIAFDVRSWSLALVAVGAATLVATNRERPVRRAEVAIGLGLVLFSMRIMSDSVVPLRTSDTVLELFERLDGVALGLLVGLVVTSVLQSSSATTALAIVLTSQGLLTTSGAVAIVLGANVGTCVTASIAAIGKPTAAVRVAVGHVSFNLVGALAWIAFVPQLTWLAERLPGGVGDPGRTLANAHTVFNVVNAAVALALLGPVARLIERVVPERNGAVRRRLRRSTPLEDSLVTTPALALAAARRELESMSRLVISASERVPTVAIEGSHDDVDRLLEQCEEIVVHHSSIVGYLTRVGREPMAEGETEEVVATIGAANELETIGGVIGTNVVRMARRRIDRGVEFGAPAVERIRGLHAEVHRALTLACQGLDERSDEAAQRVIGAKTRVHELVDRIATSAFADHPEAVTTSEAYSLERDLAEQLRRIAHVSRRIARATLEPR
jgi:phosphate:Na+ symporter